MDRFIDKPIALAYLWPRLLEGRVFVQHSDGVYTCLKCLERFARMAATLHALACEGDHDINSPNAAPTSPADMAANAELVRESNLKWRMALFKEQVDRATVLSGGRVANAKRRALTSQCSALAALLFDPVLDGPAQGPGDAALAMALLFDPALDGPAQGLGEAATDRGPGKYGQIWQL